MSRLDRSHSTLSRPKPLKPRHRDEGVRVLTPLTHFLPLLPEFGITPKLKTPAEPLHEESRVVEDLVRSRQGYIGKPRLPQEASQGSPHVRIAAIGDLNLLE